MLILGNEEKFICEFFTHRGRTVAEPVDEEIATEVTMHTYSVILKGFFMFWALLFVGCHSSPTNSDFEQTRLEGTRWSLERLRGQDMLDGSTITLKFEDEAISGFSGCNYYGAEYSSPSVKQFEIEKIMVTDMDCEEERVGIMDQEMLYVSTMLEVGGYEIQDTELRLTNGRCQEVLCYHILPEFDMDPLDLIGMEWRLLSATNLTSEEISAFTVRFDGAALGGTTVCRDYTGEYTASGDDLDIWRMTMDTIEIDCTEAQLEAESHYTTLMSVVDQYNMTGTRLELYTIRGEVLVYELMAGE